MSIFYISYGSNMAPERMAKRCPDAVMIGKGLLHHWKLTFKQTETGNHATVENTANYTDVTPFVLWEISSEDEVRLDGYESFPDVYRKSKINVITDDGKRYTNAMLYVMHGERRLGEPSDSYLTLIRNAYKANGFDETILDAAVAQTII